MIEIEKSWNDSFDVFGSWWIAGTENRVAGRLKYEDGLIRVDLLGSFHNDSLLGILKETGSNVMPIIQGRAEGKLFTLLDCRYTRKNTHSESEGTSSIDVTYAIEGAIFADEKSVSSKVIEFRHHYLEDWLCDQPVTRMTEGTGDEIVLTRQYRLLKQRKFSLPTAGCTISTGSNSRVTTDGHDDSIIHRAYWSAEFGENTSLKSLLDVAFSMSGLLTFLIGIRTGISHMAIEVDALRVMDRDIPRFARVYVRHVPHAPEKCLDWMEQRFTFPMLDGRFEEVLQQWFTRSDQLRVTHDLHAGAQFGKDQPIRFKFLNLVHSLESFDRHRGGRTYMSKEEYEPICQVISMAIRSELEGGHRDSLLNRVKYGFEISLRNRLTKMLDELPSELRCLVCNNPKEFADRVATTRNYFSHYTDELRAVAVLDNEELYWLSRRLAIWVTCSLFLEYGMKSDHVYAALERCEDSRWVLFQAPRI